MAGLQRALRRTDDFRDDVAGSADRVAHDPPHDPPSVRELLQDNDPVRRRSGHLEPGYMARPRIGTRPRARSARKRRGDGTILWRVLAVSTAVLILGTGGLLALHAMAPGAGVHAPVRADPRRTEAAIAPVVTPFRASNEKPARERTAGEKADSESLARRAAAAASALAPPASSAAPGPGSAVPDAPAADPAPTAADFARPAFLEPLSGEAADTPEETVVAEADTTVPQTDPPATAVPLPAPRPASAQEADSRSARIRMAVTLRSGPRRSASAIGTLGEGTKVTLYSCKSWCEVSAGDKRGFVYKNAVAR